MEKNKHISHKQQFVYADVILPLAVPLVYTYAIPSSINDLLVGQRVVVQLGNKKMYTAVVYALHNEKPSKYEVKTIESRIDESPIVTKIQLQLWDWIADYYMCTRGEVMKAALPAGLKLESESMLFVNHQHDNTIELSELESLAFTTIQHQQAISIDQLAKLLNKKSVAHEVKALLQKQMLLTGEKIHDSYKPKTEIRVSLAGSAQSQEFVNKAFAMLSSAPKQQALFLAFLDMQMKSKNHDFSISRKELLETTGSSLQVLQELHKKNILLCEDFEVSRLQQYTKEQITAKMLNEPQQKALQEIQESFIHQSVCLLHGVTGSGKTELYIHLIEQTIEQGKQVLYLLPEIALTSQIIQRLQKVFGNKVGVYHSRFSDNERVEVWNNLLRADSNTYQIVLGVRSSVFLPYHNLGLIIIDEEHETSFKQYDPSPRYNARDTALVLAQMHGAKALLGTATPSIETYYNVLSEKYALVELSQRHLDVPMPHIQLIDLAKAKKQKRMHDTMYSKELLEQMQLALREKQQVILFQNRRGYAPYIECTDCGHIPHCKYCDVSLTYHKFTNMLTCHYCGYSIKNIPTCNACGSSAVDSLGFGTEKIEDTLKVLFPESKIARMDLDTTRGKHAYSDLIEKFELREIDILIGTQMITKGLDFDNVGMVGILHADSMLNMPDFRAYERGFQLMVQVAGRAGRSTKQGKVFIQTYNPQMPILKQIVAHDYMAMMKTQLSERHSFQYPPYVRLIRFSVKHKDKHKTMHAAQLLASELRKLFPNYVLGPEFPPIPRIQTLYIQDILLKLPRSLSLEKARKQIIISIQQLMTIDGFKGVSWYANVDPY